MKIKTKHTITKALMAIAAVFVLTDMGLMVDASLGGQKFKYVGKYVGQ